MTFESAAHAEHPPHLAHHFENPTQQFESGKLGMWLFLGTELLMFGGLFCVYTILRANHPDVFHYSHQFLDKKLGAINTVVLICSSFTMAWGVRAAQQGRKTLLATMLALTLLCATGFLGIKYVEYSQKIRHGLLWGRLYHPQEHAERLAPADVAGRAAPRGETGAATHSTTPESASPLATGADPAAPPFGADRSASSGADRTVLPQAATPPPGLATVAPETGHAHAAVPANPQLFFGIYFAMTGLHGIHVLAGMIVISWLLAGTMRGRFGPAYFTPVDLVGLYWHIVDLIWIFLFPLFYLIS